MHPNLLLSKLPNDDAKTIQNEMMQVKSNQAPPSNTHTKTTSWIISRTKQHIVMIRNLLIATIATCLGNHGALSLFCVFNHFDKSPSY